MSLRSSDRLGRFAIIEPSRLEAGKRSTGPTTSGVDGIRVFAYDGSQSGNSSVGRASASQAPAAFSRNFLKTLHLTALSVFGLLSILSV
jgi:hypothetical protein